MSEHDRNPAARQADHPVDEDDPWLAALQQGAGRDLMYPTSQTETKTTRPRPGRPNTAPTYYLARPAGVWITAITRHARTPQVDR